MHIPSTHSLRSRDDSSSHKHNVLTFGIAIGVTLGVILLVSLSVAFSLIRRRRRAAALALTQDPGAPDPTFTTTRPVTTRPAATTSPNSPGLARLLHLNGTSLSLSRSTHTDEDTEEQECQAEYDLHGLGHGARENAPAGALEPSALMRAPASRRANPDFVPRFFAPELEPPPPPPYAGDSGDAAPGPAGAASGAAQDGVTAKSKRGKMGLKGFLSRGTSVAAASSSSSSSSAPPPPSCGPPSVAAPPVLPTPCREEPPSYPGPDDPTVPGLVASRSEPVHPATGVTVEEPPAFDEPQSRSAVSPNTVVTPVPVSGPSRASPTTSTRPSLTLSIPQQTSSTTGRS